MNIKKVNKLIYTKKLIAKKLERIFTQINYLKIRSIKNKTQSNTDCFLLYFEKKFLKIIYLFLFIKQFQLRRKYRNLEKKINNIFINQKIQH